MNASTDTDTDPPPRQGPLPRHPVLYGPVLRWNRWLVAGILAAVLAAALVLLSTLGTPPVVPPRGDPLDHLFQALIVATVTSATLVVSLNQLALKEEITPLGQEVDRSRRASRVHQSITTDLPSASAPPDPAGFLRALVTAIGERAGRFREAVANQPGAPGDEEVGTYVESIRVNAERVGNALEDATFGTFDVIDAAAGFDHTLKTVEGRALRARHGDAWNLEVHRALDALLDALAHAGPVREYLKTRYVQWDLIDLSQGVLATALLSLVVSTAGLVYLGPAALPGATWGVSHLVWAVSLATVVAMFPFLLFVAHIVRITTLAQHTLTEGPLVLRLGNREQSVGWREERR